MNENELKQFKAALDETLGSDEIETALGEKDMDAVWPEIETAPLNEHDEAKKHAEQMQQQLRRTQTAAITIVCAMFAACFFAAGFAIGWMNGRARIAKALHGLGFDVFETQNIATGAAELMIKKCDESVRAAPCPHEN